MANDVEMAKIRLDKYMTDILKSTRSQNRDIIKKGRVSVNDLTIQDVGFKVDISKDTVSLDGKILKYREFYYYMLNKPKGIICATKDETKKTVLDLVIKNKIECPKLSELFPVGRLDIDSVGLVLISNDGTLSHELLAPKKHIEKEYYVKLNSPLKDESVEIFKQGIDLGDFITKPALLEILECRDTARVIISEGKFHQIKRMFKKIGYTVLYLKRTRIGRLKLDDSLSYGEIRELTEEEVKDLKVYEKG